MYCERCGKFSGKYALCKECYNDENFCEICGENSGEYPLCKKCYYKVKEYSEEHFLDFLADVYEDETEDENYESHSPGRCIVCNQSKENSEHFFCMDCFRKYRNKEVVFSLINAKEIKILESRYYNKYKCRDGHLVKSKSEREIDNFFDKYGIVHHYEPELPIDNDPKHSIHPDFYLPSFDVYIEHWGNENDAKYQESMKYKIDIYKKRNITLICTYENEDTIDLDATLKRKLKYFKRGVINYMK